MKANEKLKVLLISPSPPPVGGIQSWTENLLDYYKHQDQIELCYIDTTVKYRGIFEMGLWKRISAGIRVTYEVIKALKNTIRINNPGVIHLSSSASLALFKDYLLMREAKKINVPVIIHWHFGRIPDLAIKKNWEWRLILHIIHNSAYSIVIDDHSYNVLINAGVKNVVNIPNPISHHLEEKARTREIIYDKRINGRVVFVGHVEREKGVFELVEACKSIPEIKELLIVGPYENEIKDELIKLSLTRENGNWLKFPGSLDNHEVLDHLETAMLMALPSYTEGFPMAIIEAMAMGCPIIATDVGAIPEMLNIKSENACGICVKPQNIRELSSALISLLNDSDKAKRMGRNGVKNVLTNYTSSKLIKLYEKVWTDALTENNVCLSQGSKPNNQQIKNVICLKY